jgi:hypothetical protein
MMHTTSASTPTRSTTKYPLKGNQNCLGPVRSAHWYIITNGLALVLLSSAACAPGGGQHAAVENNAAPRNGSLAKDVKPVPFAAFTVKFEVEDPKFQVDGDFTLGPGNNGISLMNDNVNLKIGRSSMVIPAGSFKQDEKGKMRYEAVIDGLAWTVVIRDLGEGNFRLKAKGEGAKQFGQLKPEDVILTIGDDSGSATALSN